MVIATFHWFGRSNAKDIAISSEVNVGEGVSEYYLLLNDLPLREVIEIRDKVTSMILYPLDLSMDDKSMDLVTIERIKTSLRQVLPRYLQAPIGRIVTLRYSTPETISFFPLTNGGINFYVTESERMIIMNDINLMLLSELILISPSPLVWNALSNVIVPRLILDSLVNHKGGAYILSNRIAHLNGLDEEIESIQSEIGKMKKEGYFSYCNDDLGTRLIAEEIASMFNIPSGGKLTDKCTLFKGTNIMNKRWLEDSIIRITQIGGNGIYTGSKSKLPLVKFNITKEKYLKLGIYLLQYVFSVAYSELVSIEKIYLDYIPEVKVLPDSTVILPLFSLEHLKLVIDKIDDIIHNEVSYKKYNTTRDGLKARINISAKNPGVNTLLLTVGEVEVLYFPTGITIVEDSEYDELITRICPDVDCIGERHRGSELIFRGFLPYDILPGIILNISGGIEVTNGELIVSPDVDSLSNSSTIIAMVINGIKELVTVNNVDVDKVLQLVTDKWRRGWFLNDWAYCYYRKTGKLSYSPLKRFPQLSEGRWDVDSVISLLSS